MRRALAFLLALALLVGPVAVAPSLAAMTGPQEVSHHMAAPEHHGHSIDDAAICTAHQHAPGHHHAPAGDDGPASATCPCLGGLCAPAALIPALDLALRLPLPLPLRALHQDRLTPRQPFPPLRPPRI